MPFYPALKVMYHCTIFPNVTWQVRMIRHWSWQIIDHRIHPIRFIVAFDLCQSSPFRTHHLTTKTLQTPSQQAQTCHVTVCIHAQFHFNVNASGNKPQAQESGIAGKGRFYSDHFFTGSSPILTIFSRFLLRVSVDHPVRNFHCFFSVLPIPIIRKETDWNPIPSGHSWSNIDVKSELTFQWKLARSMLPGSWDP